MIFLTQLNIPIPSEALTREGQLLLQYNRLHDDLTVIIAFLVLIALICALVSIHWLLGARFK